MSVVCIVLVYVNDDSGRLLGSNDDDLILGSKQIASCKRLAIERFWL